MDAGEVSRTSENNYWAHIVVNQDDAFSDGSTFKQARGVILGAGVLKTGSTQIETIEEIEKLKQFALLIQPGISRSAKSPMNIGSLGGEHARSAAAQHLIDFPGGVIELSRVKEGYWVHLTVKTECRVSGAVIGGRII